MGWKTELAKMESALEDWAKALKEQKDKKTVDEKATTARGTLYKLKLAVQEKKKKHPELDVKSFESILEDFEKKVYNV